jgi:hypothetical protein
MPTQAEQVVRAWNECYAAQDIDGAQKFLAPGFTREGEWPEWTIVDGQTWADTQRNFMAAWPDWSWELINLVADEEWVVCEFIERGTWTEPFEILPGHVLEPTGTAYEDRDCVLFRVNADGQIEHVRAYVTKNLEKAYGLYDKVITLMEASAT